MCYSKYKQVSISIVTLFSTSSQSCQLCYHSCLLLPLWCSAIYQCVKLSLFSPVAFNLHLCQKIPKKEHNNLWRLFLYEKQPLNKTSNLSFRKLFLSFLFFNALVHVRTKAARNNIWKNSWTSTTCYFVKNKMFLFVLHIRTKIFFVK